MNPEESDILRDDQAFWAELTEEAREKQWLKELAHRRAIAKIGEQLAKINGSQN